MADLGVIVRISSWDRANTKWKCQHIVRGQVIEDIQCTFTAHRIEDRCSVTLFDAGHLSTKMALGVVVTEKEQTDVADLLTRTGPLYRLDVLSPETSDVYEGRTTVTDFQDWPFFWSGVVQRIEAVHDDARRGAKITAAGWTWLLDRIVLRDRFYYNYTIRQIVQDIFSLASNGIDAVWPGNIQHALLSDGSDQYIKIERIGWKMATARQILDDLAEFGDFYYGVSVHGWPFNDDGTETDEFAFHAMMEPFYARDPSIPAPGAQGHATGPECWIDVINHPLVVEWRTERDDSRYVTRWEIEGEQLHADIVSCISGMSATTIRDTFAIGSGESGAYRWEPGGFVGWELVLLDKAVREKTEDKDTGEVYEAGRIESVPIEIEQLDGDTTFPIDGYSETASYVAYTVNQFPATELDLTLDLTDSALRYTLRPTSIRALRVVMDEEQDDATLSVSRDRIARLVSNFNVRGYTEAGLFALLERYQERFASRHATLKVRRWTRFITGSKRLNRGVIGIGTGSERMTLLGTTGNGGDNYQMGDDSTRTVGFLRMYEMRRATATYTDDGWDITYDLAGTPRDFVTVVLPQSVRGRNRRRN